MSNYKRVLAAALAVPLRTELLVTLSDGWLVRIDTVYGKPRYCDYILKPNGQLIPVD